MHSGRNCSVKYRPECSYSTGKQWSVASSGYIQVKGGLRLAVCFLGLVHEEAREVRSMNLVCLLISFSGFMSRACPEKHTLDLYDLCTGGVGWGNGAFIVSIVHFFSAGFWSRPCMVLWFVPMMMRYQLQGNAGPHPHLVQKHWFVQGTIRG
jgi:hypothetical protein